VQFVAIAATPRKGLLDVSWCPASLLAFSQVSQEGNDIWENMAVKKKTQVVRNPCLCMITSSTVFCFAREDF